MGKVQKAICSIPYYRREQYDLLRKVSEDKENFEKSYEEVMVLTESTRREMEKSGAKVVKIVVDVEELIKRADSMNVSITPESRNQFYMEKLKEELSKDVS